MRMSSLNAKPCTCLCTHQRAVVWRARAGRSRGSNVVVAMSHGRGTWGSGLGGAFLAASLLLNPAPVFSQSSPTAAAPPQLSNDSSMLDLPPLPTQFPPLPNINPASYQQFTLDNGLKVFLMEDHEVPLIKGSILMKGGQYAAPGDKLGVATIFSSVQRSGGTVAHPRDVLDDRLDELAAGIDSAAGRDASVVDFICAKEDAEEVVNLWAEVIRTPAVPEEMIELTRSQIINLLQHRNDNPSNVARRELLKLIYGRDSIYAREATLTSVVSLTRDDLLQYKDAWQRPDGAIVGVVGDFDTDAMLKLIQQTLGEWTPAPGQPQSPPAVLKPSPTIRAEAPGVVYLIDRPGLTQASVVTAEVGVDLMDPDTPALDVLGTIFNSFGGKLFDEIRSKGGLAYSVSGGWDTPLDHAGVFLASGQTSRPAEFLEALRQVLDTATESAPSTDEVLVSKSQALNQFVFNYTSTAAQLQRVLLFDMLGLPQDYVLQYNQKIGAVEAEDILAAAQRHLHPEAQTIVMVADRQESEPNLDAAGFHAQILQLDTET